MSRCHGSKISRCQNSFLAETVITLSNDGKVWARNVLFKKRRITLLYFQSRGQQLCQFFFFKIFSSHRSLYIYGWVPIQPSHSKRAIFRTGFDFTVFFSGSLQFQLVRSLTRRWTYRINYVPRLFIYHKLTITYMTWVWQTGDHIPLQGMGSMLNLDTFSWQESPCKLYNPLSRWSC